MKVKVSESSGPVLDWMVGMAEGKEAKPAEYELHRIVRASGRAANYSTDPTQAYPIIERDRIGTRPNGNDWVALHINPRVKAMTGPTPLIAAMRCFVASKLGEEVEVPAELLT